MNRTEQKKVLKAAVAAAQQAGALMRRNLRSPKVVKSHTQHDIKLELDVRCQALIERLLLAALPASAFFGEEGMSGTAGSDHRWIVDPIDGTVNFSHGIPHSCVSIALQQADKGSTPRAYETTVGVVYDPFTDELWTAIRGEPARLNGRAIHVSTRTKLSEAMISAGFGNSEPSLNHMLLIFNHLAHRVRKLRIMGSAALAMTYVATGRFDAFVEAGVRLWDIAAGGLILECAGGEFWHRPLPGDHAFEIRANNGRIRPALDKEIQPFSSGLDKQFTKNTYRP